MAVPKQKTSRAKTRSRRAQNLKFKKPTVSVCPVCETPIRPHHICETCGYYKDEPVLVADGYSELNED